MVAVLQHAIKGTRVRKYWAVLVTPGDGIFDDHNVWNSLVLCYVLVTAGAVSIATTHRKRSGIKIEISPLTNMIETSGFFLYTHICSSNVSERRRSDIFNRFLDM